MQITKEMCEITVTAEQDDIPVRGNAMASGDDTADRETEDAILARLDAGEVWAWAAVTVTVTWKGLTASDHLGGCSYDSEEQFREPGGYFDDMVSACLESINDQAKQIVESLK